METDDTVNYCYEKAHCEFPLVIREHLKYNFKNKENNERKNNTYTEFLFKFYSAIAGYRSHTNLQDIPQAASVWLL